MVNWEKLFDQKDINAKVSILNETILNVFRNYVPSKYTTIDDKDPVWINENIKSRIKTNSIKNVFRMENFQVTMYFLKPL